MKYISLYFDEPIQSYGSNSKFDFRNTEIFVTRSAISGMICNALNLFGDQEDFLNLLKEKIKISVFSFSDPIIFTDYQIVGNHDKHKFYSLKTEDEKFSSNKIHYKKYLSNAKFGIIIESEDENLINQINVAFKEPKNILYLGRKCCVLSKTPYVGIYEDKTIALTKIKEFSKLKDIKIYYEITEVDNDSDEIFEIMDVPLKFGEHIIYASRKVYKKWYC